MLNVVFFYSSAARGKVVMCDPVCEHRFRSCHTIYFIVSIDDIGYWTIPSFVEPFTFRHISVAGTLLVPANIRATTMRYRQVHRTHIIVCHAIVRQFCYPSSYNPRYTCIFSAAPFFSTGALRLRHLIYSENLENSARARVIRTTLAIIQWESITQGTSR